MKRSMTRAVRRFWWIFAVAAFPWVLTLGWELLAYQPRHFLQLRMQVWPDPPPDFGQRANDLDYYWQNAEYAASALADWMEGDLYGDLLTGGRDSVDEEELEIQVDTEKTSLTIKIEGFSAQLLAQLSDQVVAITQSDNARHIPQLAEHPMRIILVDGPTLGVESPSRRWLPWLLRLVAALLLATMLALLAHRANPIIWGEEDVPLTVIASIPDDGRNLS